LIATVKLDCPAPRRLIVPFFVTGTAIAGEDYVAPAGSELVLEPERNEANLTIALIEAPTPKQAEELTIHVLPAWADVVSATTTIGPDAAPVPAATPTPSPPVRPQPPTTPSQPEKSPKPTAVVSFAPPRTTAVKESDGTLPLTVQLDGEATGEIEVELSLSTKDLTLPSPPIARLGPLKRSTIVPVGIVNDDIHQGNRTTAVTLTEDRGYTLGNPSRIDLHIEDDEPLPKIAARFEPNPAATGQMVRLIVSLSGLSAEDLSIPLELDGTARVMSPPRTVTVAARQPSAAISLQLGPGEPSEDDKKLLATLRPPRDRAEPAQVEASLTVTAGRLGGDLLVLLLWTAEAESRAEVLRMQLKDYMKDAKQKLVGDKLYVIGENTESQVTLENWPPRGLQPFRNQTIQDVIQAGVLRGERVLRKAGGTPTAVLVWISSEEPPSEGPPLKLNGFLGHIVWIGGTVPSPRLAQWFKPALPAGQVVNVHRLSHPAELAEKLRSIAQPR
jgi:hypothetical protein